MKRIKFLSMSILAFIVIGSNNALASSFTEFVETDVNQEVKFSDTEYDSKDVKDVKTLLVNEEESYAKIALDFSKGFVGHDKLVVSEMIPIYDVEKILVGYSVKMTLDGVDNGYVIVDSRLKGDYIAEFNLDLNTPDLFTGLVEASSTETHVSVDEVSNDEKLIIESETNVYNINLNDVVVGTDGLVIDSEEFISEVKNEHLSAAASPYDHAQYAMVDYPVSYTTQSYKYVGYFKSLDSGRPQKLLGKYGCSVSAATILMDKLNISPGATGDDATLKVTYNKLWDYSGTTTMSTGQNLGKTISYGGTYDSKWPDALKKYAKEKNKTINAKYVQSPTFSQMKSELDNNRNFIYGYDITKNNNNGHAIAVQGYYIGKKGNDTHQFIVFADGWNVSSRYMNMSTNAKYLNWSRMVVVW